MCTYKYILILVDEREITTYYFYSYKEAYAEMERQLLEDVLGNKVDEPYYERGEEWDCDDYSAWANDIYGHNYDWYIEAIPDKEDV
jgi:hypothetical protein